MELDLILRWSPRAEGFEVALIYDHPGTKRDYQQFVDKPLLLDTNRLWDARQDAQEYGQILTDMVFKTPNSVLSSWPRWPRPVPHRCTCGC